MKQNEHLYTQEELLSRIARNGSNMYGYFIRERRGILPKALARQYGVPDTIDHMPDWMVEQGNVAPESVEAWRKLFSDMEKGEKHGFAQVSLKAENGTFGRFWIRFNGIDDEQGVPFFAMISIEDMTLAYMHLRQSEAMQLQAEELRLMMSRMGKVIVYYDIQTSTLTIPPSQAKRKELPVVLPDFPERFMEQSPLELSPEARAIIQKFYQTIRSGELTGSCEYRCLDKDGTDYWERLEFASIFDEEGHPLRAVITVENVTSRHLQARENLQLKENERLLRLVNQHSDRTICYYDIQKETAQVWDQETCERCQLPRLCQMNRQTVLDSGDILPESIEDLRGFFQDIHDGKPSGAINMRVKTPSGDRRWFDLQFSTIYNEDGVPVSAMISHKDITKQYEHEKAYLRQMQFMDNSETHLGTMEVDLMTDLIEKQGGRMSPPGTSAVGRTLTDFGYQMVLMKMLKEDQSDGLRFFSREHLLSQYAEGCHQMIRIWRMRFRNGELKWVHTVVELMPDPYTGHIKAFFRMTDVTTEQEATLAIQYRSEQDGMTKLLNRATTEEKIRDMIAMKSPPGILVLLDLDDLKGINDIFGHKEGDRAILKIAETLKSHFRENDIIGRIGGDEFMVYLPGASENKDAIAVSVVTLLRKLTTVSIGDNDERRIHCSIGCAVQTDLSDSFEELYKQADTALYHVKRNGKNNFAFYSPDMDQEDYQFQAEKLLSMKSVKKFGLEELQNLLSAIATFYQLVLSINLSSNDYHLMEEIVDGVFSRLPPFGVMDDFVQMTASMIHPSDVSGFMEHLSRKDLLQAYARGEKSVRHYFRFRRGEEYLWTEAIAVFYTNENGDVCDFTLVRWADERAVEMEQMLLQKVLELAVASTFEYICLVDVNSGDCLLCGNEKNTHLIPRKGNFDEVTQNIRDHFIQPDEREAYYENAKLNNVKARMLEGKGTYAYQYMLSDGIRQASFHWFEPTHTQLLMTVQRCF